MNIKANIGFHNKFIIEVTRNKKVIKKGYTENIVLDRAYTRLCYYYSYFSYIHYGGGTGTLDPTRTTLFSPIGYRSAVTEETIKEFPVSSWTRKVVLNPEEYVGDTFTEVGISDSTSSINTHALIKDSEGNPLSITKTDIDVITIYATIFIELIDSSDNFFFAQGSDNTLLSYLTGGSAPNGYIQVGEYQGEALKQTSIGMWIEENSTTKTVTVAEKKITYTTRFGITEANTTHIAEVGLTDVARVILPETNIFTSYSLEDVNLGAGDGSITEFELPHVEPSSIVIKKDGVITNDITIMDAEKIKSPRPLPLADIIDDTHPYSSIFLRDGFNGIDYILKSRTILGSFKSKVDLTGYEFFNATFANYYRISLHYSYDEVTYTRLVDLGQNESIVINVDALYWKVECFYYFASGNSFYVYLKPPNYTMPKVVFNTPPDSGNVITANYSVPYIPKDENYVLDVTFELIFGEGV